MGYGMVSFFRNEVCLVWHRVVWDGIVSLGRVEVW